MAEDTWYSRAVPILEVIAASEDTQVFLDVGDISDQTGIEPLHVVTELERLIGGGYVAGELEKAMTGGDPRPWFLTEARLGPVGARVVGAWPPDDSYDALIALLDRRIQGEPDETKRSKLRQWRDGAVEVGKGTAIAVLTEVLKRGI